MLNGCCVDGNVGRRRGACARRAIKNSLGLARLLSGAWLLGALLGALNGCVCDCGSSVCSVYLVLECSKYSTEALRRHKLAVKGGNDHGGEENWIL